MQGKRITAFYMEMLVLVAVFTGVILLLSQVFVTAKEQSAQAKVLTNAVCLAENAAGVHAAYLSVPELILGQMDENHNAALEEDGRIRARYAADMAPDPSGPFTVKVDCREGVVEVYWLEEDEPVFRLETGAAG